MSAYSITAGIPVPPKRKARFPLREMKVGDSFFVPKKEAGKSGLRLYQAVGNNGRYTNHRFSVRKQEGGYRIWRVK